MAATPVASGAGEQLASFYEVVTSVERVLASLRRAGVDTEQVQARDLYERDLDCQNNGGFAVLGAIAATAAGWGVPGPGDTVLDIGCGMGGPGRYLADRFGCSVAGIDLLAARVESAQALSELSGLAGRTSYRVADAAGLPFEDGSFAQVWVLDVSIHVTPKAAMFAEVARVLRAGGLLVLHDQLGPLPAAMAPVTRLAPYVAQTLPQLISAVEEVGLQVLTWQDTTAPVLASLRQARARLDEREPPADGRPRPWREWARLTGDAYLAALGEQGGRMGLVVARSAPTS